MFASLFNMSKKFPEFLFLGNTNLKKLFDRIRHITVKMILKDKNIVHSILAFYAAQKALRHLCKQDIKNCIRNLFNAF